mmetsp:Transcript_46598/g.141154  ORF Transcript_46598/g.141154 Transcript_46598/m.141154 type:complete len:352 (-) Transcript_46598:28-1083(-)
MPEALNMALTGTFKYVLIPADSSEPIDTREGDKSGGLSDDFLAKEARRYFFDQSGGDARAAALENASPEEKKALADQIRKQAADAAGGRAGPNKMSQMDDEALINMVRATQASASCEIMAVTVPTKLNSHHAVSIYGADDAKTRNLPINARATAIMQACGHGAFPPGDDGSPGGVSGDVFVGRCRDDEVGDVWERVDFTCDDANPGSEWCHTARTSGGGGGHGGTAGAPSLSGMMTQAFGGGGAGTGTMVPTAGGEAEADGYRWSQTDDEVEIKFSVASGLKAKYVKVNFGRKSVKVTAAGQTLANGETGGDMIVDECTYTIQDDKESGRELCLSLAKRVETNWGYAILPK